MSKRASYANLEAAYREANQTYIMYARLDSLTKEERAQKKYWGDRAHALYEKLHAKRGW